MRNARYYTFGIIVSISNETVVFSYDIWHRWVFLIKCEMELIVLLKVFGMFIEFCIQNLIQMVGL